MSDLMFDTHDLNNLHRYKLRPGSFKGSVTHLQNISWGGGGGVFTRNKLTVAWNETIYEIIEFMAITQYSS